MSTRHFTGDAGAIAEDVLANSQAGNIIGLGLNGPAARFLDDYLEPLPDERPDIRRAKIMVMSVLKLGGRYRLAALMEERRNARGELCHAPFFRLQRLGTNWTAKIFARMVEVQAFGRNVIQMEKRYGMANIHPTPIISITEAKLGQLERPGATPPMEFCSGATHVQDLAELSSHFDSVYVEDQPQESVSMEEAISALSGFTFADTNSDATV